MLEKRESRVREEREGDVRKGIKSEGKETEEKVYNSVEGGRERKDRLRGYIKKQHEVKQKSHSVLLLG